MGIALINRNLTLLDANSTLSALLLPPSHREAQGSGVGEAQGLAPDLAMQLAKATVAGAGALAEAADETPAQLRVNVTSPNGTTQAGLEVLMDDAAGLPPLMERTVAAAANRSRELRND